MLIWLAAKSILAGVLITLLIAVFLLGLQAASLVILEDDFARIYLIMTPFTVAIFSGFAFWGLWARANRAKDGRQT